MLQEKINHRFRAYPTHQAVQTQGSTALISNFLHFRVKHYYPKIKYSDAELIQDTGTILN
jgi:hypothetical protein